MRKTFKSITIFLIFMSSAYCLSGQELDKVSVDLDYFYNEWSLSPESRENVLVYKDEYDLTRDDIAYDPSLNLKFTIYDNSFYLNYSASRKRYVRCGNDIPKNLNVGRSLWHKGVWEIFVEDGTTYLVLKHMTAEKGKGYVLRKKEIFQILKLQEDGMILQMLENKI